MDTFNLRALVAVFDHRSVSAAARELSMTQAGVSMLLHRLESRYGVELVHRRAHGVEPTAAGQVLYAYAKEVLWHEAVLDRHLEWERRRNQGWVWIGASPTVAGYVLPPILSEFRARHPEWQLTVETWGWSTMRDHLLSGQLDFALMPRQTDTALVHTLVRQERMLIVAAPGSPFAAHELVDPAELLRHPFVLSGRNSATCRLLEKALGGSERVHLTIALEVLDIEAKKEAVRRGLGYGLLSESSVQRELREGTLCEIHVAGLALSREICLVHRQHGDLSPAAAALFTEILQSLGQRLSSPAAGRAAGRRTRHRTYRPPAPGPGAPAARPCG